MPYKVAMHQLPTSFHYVLGKPCQTKSAVFLTLFKQGGGEGIIPMFKNFDLKCVTFKGPFGSIN